MDAEKKEHSQACARNAYGAVICCLCGTLRDERLYP